MTRYQGKGQKTVAPPPQSSPDGGPYPPLTGSPLPDDAPHPPLTPDPYRGLRTGDDDWDGRYIARGEAPSRCASLFGCQGGYHDTGCPLDPYVSVSEGAKRELARRAEADRAPDMVASPPHYQAPDGTQVIDFIDSFSLGHYEATIVAYVVRWERKNGLEDLKKAKFYLDRLIRMREGARP